MYKRAKTVYPIVASRVRWCVRVGRASKSQALRLSRGFLVGSSPRRLPRNVPGPRSVIFWACLSRARPFSARDAPWLPLLLSLLQRCFRSTVGAAILYLSSNNPNVGGTPSIRPGQSVCLLSHRPFPSRNPAFQCQ